MSFRIAFRQWLVPEWIVRRKSVVAMVVLTVIWNLTSPVEALNAHFPLVTHPSLRFYQWLSDLDPRPHYVKWVTPVEIDDDTYWQAPLNGRTPTDRKYLAQLIRNAADGGAAVIALDFMLNDTGHETERQSQNSDLFAAIQACIQKGIPVVLPVWLHRESPDEPGLKQKPLIFPARALNVDLGFVNFPADVRQIPTVTMARSSDPSDNATKQYDSFALKIVRTYEKVAGRHPTSDEKQIIRRAMDRQVPVYGSFVPQYMFATVSAQKLWLGDATSKAQCEHRIVLIGGTYHLEFGSGPMADVVLTPVGNIPGLYLHANYVEALLDDRVQGLASENWGLLIDLVILYLVYSVPLWVEEKVARFAVWGILFVPIVGSYILLANVGRYLDFEAPLVGSFLHVTWDQSKDWITFAATSIRKSTARVIRVSFRRIKERVASKRARSDPPEDTN